MPRPLRINYPNAWYHVMNRGAGKQKIFKNAAHRKMFLLLLEESQKLFNVEIHAYCLMDNHYHLLLSTPDANLSRVMRHINGVYTLRYNRRQNTDGPLFRGRYKAQLIEEDYYLLIVSRYIHMNPVKAKLVNNPADYEWSSYRAYLGLINPQKWLSTHVILQQVNSQELLSRVKNYRDYVETKDIQQINIFNGTKYTSPIIGTEAFKEKALLLVNTSNQKECAADIKRAKITPKIKLIIETLCAFFGITHESLMQSRRGQPNWPRMVCMYICRKYYGYPLKQISQSFGTISHVTVSTTVIKCEYIIKNQKDRINQVELICRQIKEAHLQGDT
jgi:putative transposase